MFIHRFLKFFSSAISGGKKVFPESVVFIRIPSLSKMEIFVCNASLGVASNSVSSFCP